MPRSFSRKTAPLKESGNIMASEMLARPTIVPLETGNKLDS